MNRRTNLRFKQLVALVLSLVKDVSFVQALTMPYTVALAASALAVSYIGFERKAGKSGA